MHDVEVRLEVDGMKLHVRKLSGAAYESLPPTVALPPLDEPASTREPPAEQPNTGSTIVSSAPSAIAERPAANAAVAASVPSGHVAIRAPMLGRFFRAPAPSEPPYVQIGSRVEPDDTVCIIEVMKLFNTVRAGVRGTIERIDADNAAMVEHDAVLFLVRPA